MNQTDEMLENLRATNDKLLKHMLAIGNGLAGAVGGDTTMQMDCVAINELTGERESDTEHTMRKATSNVGSMVVAIIQDELNRRKSSKPANSLASLLSDKLKLTEKK